MKKKNEFVSIGPIMETKLHVPEIPASLLSRTRLIEKMNRTLQTKLTVVTAPPGYGKSSLFSEWVRHSKVFAGWISLDPGENDVKRFWRYMIAAMQRIHEGFGEQVLSMLLTPFYPTLYEMISSLINELIYFPHHAVLILDDYHVIDSDEVHHSLAYFLERAPMNVHLCVASRTEVPLLQGKLRVKGHLNEITMSDLRLTGEEIAIYWKQLVGVTLFPSEQKLLEERTEGWIAGLQLTALTHKEVLLIDTFSGGHRFLVDYLKEEVFQHLSKEVQAFLVQTSILDRMNDKLCAELVGSDAVITPLRLLEQENLFLIPLDIDYHWYRYHHLFADFLRSLLRQYGTEQIRKLYCRASEWFERNQYLRESIDYAIRGEDYERASQLLVNHASLFFKQRELSTIERWLAQLPEKVVNEPDLVIIKGWTKLLSGNLEGSKQCAENLLRKLAVRDSSLSPDQEIRLVEEILLIKHFSVMTKGDFASACGMIGDSLNPEDIEDKLVHLERELFFLAGMEIHASHASMFRGFVGSYGNLKNAEMYHKCFLELLEKNHLQSRHFAANHYTALCEIHYEKNELEKALKLGKTACDLSCNKGNIGAYVPAALTIAKIYWANGDHPGAVKAIEESMKNLRRLCEHPDRWTAVFQAYLARCYMLIEDYNRTTQWLEMCQISGVPEFFNYQDYENLTLLRALMIQKRHFEAKQFSNRLLLEAESEGRSGSIVEGNLLQAILLYQMSEIDHAVHRLHETLCLAEKEGFFRLIIDERPFLKELFKEYVQLRKHRRFQGLQSGASLAYVEKLITAMGEDEFKLGQANHILTEHVSPLTKRELEVLTCLSQGLSNKEIAEKLSLSEGTVKLHLNRIYSKLNCTNRIQAIQTAKRLHLLKI
ncbi:LuxR C-terminal-related transcriptional regulator [Brevibacillus sp. SYSU BS000544]|uniref:LuxR C-terminal-related transcriptional regulator n=1 Tax=Brevibacillus sp. SYSU BS000544 TaxID=3416443 RepID=UPI003CE5C2BD